MDKIKFSDCLKSIKRILEIAAATLAALLAAVGITSCSTSRVLVRDTSANVEVSSTNPSNTITITTEMDNPLKSN